MRGRWFGLILGLVLLPAPLLALDVGSDGSDGALNVTGTQTIDLNQARTGPWNTTNGFGNGVYDPSQWAVVFKFTTINVSSGATLNFINNKPNAPVVFLASGDVTIAGTITLNGEDWNSTCRYPAGGPGGFAGGLGNMCSTGAGGGFGPGGAAWSANGVYGSAGYASPGVGTGAGVAYGNERILPLIGGSGGSSYSPPGNTFHSGSGGGGAILIASNVTIQIASTGKIRANGGVEDFGGGSGGGIRLIADIVIGYATNLFALGNAGLGLHGAPGRIRVEANMNSLIGTGNGSYTTGPINNGLAEIFPSSSTPAVRITQVGTQTVPADPSGAPGGGDVFIRPPLTDIPVLIEAMNIPVTAPEAWAVKVHFVPLSGASSVVDATFTGGNQALSTWRAIIPSFPEGLLSGLQVRATAP